MNADAIRTLFAYNRWANERIIAATRATDPANHTDPAPGLSFGTLLGSLVHIYAAEVVWRQRCQHGRSPEALPQPDQFDTLGDLLDVWQPEMDAWVGYITALTDDDLAGSFSYATTRGTPHEATLWPVLAHVVNHGTQFRQEAAVRLTQVGQSPGDLDLLIYLRQRD